MDPQSLSSRWVPPLYVARPDLPLGLTFTLLSYSHSRLHKGAQTWHLRHQAPMELNAHSKERSLFPHFFHIIIHGMARLHNISYTATFLVARLVSFEISISEHSKYSLHMVNNSDAIANNVGRSSVNSNILLTFQQSLRNVT